MILESSVASNYEKIVEEISNDIPDELIPANPKQRNTGFGHAGSSGQTGQTGSGQITSSSQIALSGTNANPNAVKVYLSHPINVDKTYNPVLNQNDNIKIDQTHFHQFVSTGIYSMNNPYYNIILSGLRKLYLDDEDDVFEWLMIFFSSCLDFRQKEPIILFLIGGGSNGKSTIVELMKSVLGDYCKKLDIGLLVQGRTGAEAASPSKMGLENTRMVYYSESDRNEELQVAKIKEFLSGETITGRKLNQDQREFKPKCNHIVTSNFKLIIKTKDHGTWRRIFIYNHKKTLRSAHEYDPTDKRQMLKNSDFNTTFVTNDQCREAFLAILVDYYKKAMSKTEDIIFSNMKTIK
jgi:hypothetical protein